MNVLTEKLNQIDYKDEKKALAQLEAYVRYMAERIQFMADVIERTGTKTGSGAPKESMEGTIGQIYIDQDAKKAYVMVARSGQIYTWKELRLT